MPKIDFSRMFTRRAGRVVSRIVVVSIVATSALASNPSEPRAQTSSSLVVPLSADFDYAPICNKRNDRRLSADWTKWDGRTPPVSSFDNILLDAQSYITGNGKVPRDKVVARRMLEYLRAQNYSFAPRASALLGALLVDPASGPVDVARSVTLAQEGIDHGFFEGATFLGRLYGDGLLVAKDLLKSEQYFKRAADAGDPNASLLLARLYISAPELAPSGDAVPVLFNRAVTNLSKKLNTGQCDVLNIFAGIYASDDFGLFDPVIATKWLHASAKTGDFTAIERLARRYMVGEGVPVDRAKAVALLRDAAEKGSSGSRLLLARLYLENTDLPNAIDNAKQWLQIEADRGNGRAYEILANVARGDFGGPPDNAAMFINLEKASHNAVVDVDVLKQLGIAYAHGLGTASNLEKAIEYLSQASNMGSDSASFEMFTLINDNRGSVDFKSNPVAVLRRAANNGFSEAMAALSDAYSCGVGVDRNPEIGFRWLARAAATGNRPSLIEIGKRALLADAEEGGNTFFRNMRRAATLGDRQAMVYLADAYRRGIGTDIDLALADRWYADALAPGNERSQALLLLARMEIAKGERANMIAAEKLLLEGLSTGDSSILFELAKLYGKGADGIPPNAPRALELFVQAGMAGHGGSMLQLADYRVPTEQSGGRDWRQWLDRAAQTGNIRAILKEASIATEAKQRVDKLMLALKQPLCDIKEQVAVAAAIINEPSLKTQTQALVHRALTIPTDDAGTLYQLANVLMNAEMVGRDAVSGPSVMLKAAQAGKVEAMREVGRMYIEGAVLPANFDEAVKWLTLAVRAGDQGAIKSVAELALDYKKTGKAPDVVLKAVLEPLKLAAASGSGSAAKAIAELYASTNADGGLVQQWMLKAGNLNDGEAMVFISDAYAAGSNGFDQSDAKSTEWLAKAAKAGYPPAFERYAIALQIGYGTPVNMSEAGQWLEKAGTVTQ